METALLPKEEREGSENIPLNGPIGQYGISANQLKDIVNKYKERDENMQDINYFNEQGGIDRLLQALQTDKTKSISSTKGREEQFGSNKVFQKPLQLFVISLKKQFLIK